MKKIASIRLGVNLTMSKTKRIVLGMVAGFAIFMLAFSLILVNVINRNYQGRIVELEGEVTDVRTQLSETLSDKVQEGYDYIDLKEEYDELLNQKLSLEIELNLYKNIADEADKQIKELQSGSGNTENEWLRVCVLFPSVVNSEDFFIDAKPGDLLQNVLMKAVEIQTSRTGQLERVNQNTGYYRVVNITQNTYIDDISSYVIEEGDNIVIMFDPD